MHNGSQILSIQNQSVNIDKLLAQRKMYSDAKILQYIILFSTVVVPVALSYFTNFTDFKIDDKSWIFVTYSILIVIVEKVVESSVSRSKKIAASIQEKFDVDVLGIPDNQLLNTAFVDLTVIRAYSKEGRKNSAKVKRVEGWYSSEIGLLETNIAVLFCQRMNVCYDFSIKKKYNCCLIMISVATFMGLLFPSLIGDFLLQKFVVEVLFPSLPVFLFTYKEVNASIESIDNLQKLREVIESEMSKACPTDTINQDIVRKIQDRIYENRILSPLIPDFIYKFLWTKLEDEMNYSVKNRIIELKQG